MKIQLHQRVSRDTDAAPDDVRILKKALNRLGYYIPDAARGITKIADTDMIDAVKKFQQANGLKMDGVVLPDGETARMLNQKLAEPSTAKLEWHCVKDDNSCDTCEAFDSTIVDTDEFDTPGCDGICRCWVMPVMDYEAPDRIEPVYPLEAVLGVKAISRLPTTIKDFLQFAKRTRKYIRVNPPRSKLQHEYKHARDFNVYEKSNNNTLEELRLAIEKHVNSFNVKVIKGTYHKVDVNHYINLESRTNVILDQNGNLVGGWKLSDKQFMHVMRNGKLGGGR